MELKLDREKIICPIVPVRTEISQSAEHDFILPDYCPDIFRVLKCSVTPGITSAGINGNRLTFELNVVIRVIYRTGDGSGLYCVEQGLDYSKSLDLPNNTANPGVSITPTVEYVNCRAVNQRRIDVRSSIVCKVRVESEKSIEAVCNAFGEGIQLRKTPVIYPSKRITAAKRITVIEELEPPVGKPALGSILRCSADVKKGEQKIIPGKLITKGEAQVSLLYLDKDNSGKPPESMKFTVPFSQIIDVDGLEADFDSEVEIIPSKCVIVPKADENSVLECELVLLVNITAVKYATCELVTDAYSTKYECECGFIDTKPQLPPIKQEVSVSVQSSLSCSDGEISQVYDMWCESPTVSARYDEDKEMYMLYGKVNFCALCKLSDGSVGYAEKESAFEEPLNMGDKDCAALNVAADAAIDGCSYTLSENGSIDAKAQLTITAKCTENCCPALMESVEILKDKPKDCDKSCAVKICYSDETTSLWEIAKKYSTSAAAITEENRLDEKAENGRRVLIIPMKN